MSAAVARLESRLAELCALDPIRALCDAAGISVEAVFAGEPGTHLVRREVARILYTTTIKRSEVADMLGVEACTVRKWFRAPPPAPIKEIEPVAPCPIASALAKTKAINARRLRAGGST